MYPIQSCKFVGVVPPQVIQDNTSWTANAIDTLGWKHCLIIGYLGATDIAMAAASLTQSNDDSTYVAVTGSDYNSVSTLPSATADNTMFAWDIPIDGTLRRYLKPTLTAGNGAAGTYLTCIAVLSKGEDGPDTDAERGFAIDCVYV